MLTDTQTQISNVKAKGYVTITMSDAERILNAVNKNNFEGWHPNKDTFMTNVGSVGHTITASKDNHGKYRFTFYDSMSLVSCMFEQVHFIDLKSRGPNVLELKGRSAAVVFDVSRKRDVEAAPPSPLSAAGADRL